MSFQIFNINSYFLDYFKEVLKNILVISKWFYIFESCVTVLDFVFQCFSFLNVLYKKNLDCVFPLTVCVMLLCFALVF